MAKQEKKRRRNESTFHRQKAIAFWKSLARSAIKSGPKMVSNNMRGNFLNSRKIGIGDEYGQTDVTSVSTMDTYLGTAEGCTWKELEGPNLTNK